MTTIDFQTMIMFLHDRIDEDLDGEHLSRDTNGHLIHASRDRVLAECKAKRQIVGNCDAVINGSGWPTLAQYTLRYLAAIYSEHPDYQEEWQTK